MLRPNYKRIQVNGLKESRLIISWDENQDPFSSEEVWTRPMIYNYNRFVSQSEMI